MLKRFSLLLLLVMVGLMCWWPRLTRAATMPGAKGDAVLYSETDTIDVPVLKMNGVTVGTVAPVIFAVRTNQTLAAATVIQHGSFNDRIEIVQISSTGGALTSTASPRILAGVQGQIIVLQGTSATNTYTIPDGNGIRLTTSGSATFSDRSMMILRYDTTGSVWREASPLTGAPTAIKAPVRVASTANITLSGTQTIDGVALSVGQRVLAKNQTTASENGPYTVGTPWVRAVDFDESAEAVTNAEFLVEEGTQAGSKCHMTTTGAITLGSTALAFSCNSVPYLDLAELAADPVPPPAGLLRVYGKNNGLLSRNSAGNIVGPYGTGGGGGGTGLTARLISTTNIASLNGEVTLEGITTSGTRVFLAGQTTGTQNGIWVTASGAWTRATDAAAGAAFTAGTLVTIYDGIAGQTGNKGTTWMYTTSGTYGSSTLTAIDTGTGPTTELLANRSTVATSVANGYIGSDANGRVAYNRLGSGAVHTALSAASTIDPTTTTSLEIGIAGSGGNVNLTSNPQIAAGINGQLLILYGTSTNTVQIDNGTGVRLCRNAGSVIVGIDRDDLILRYDTVAAAWVQQGCRHEIYGATDLASAFKVCDTPNGSCTNFFASTTQGTNSGGVIDQITNCPSGKNCKVQVNGVEFENLTSPGGLHTYSNGGKPLGMVVLPAGNLGGSANCTYMQDEAWIASGELQSAWRCTDNDADFLSFSLPMPRAWDRGVLIFQHQVHSLTNQNTTVVGEDVALRCVRQGDADAAYSATGAQTLTATFGNQANDNRYPLSALVTPNGTCTGEAAGTTVIIKGRIRIRATPTTATMTNVRLASLTIFYRAASRSND